MSLDLLLAGQAGVISREQALRAGVSGADVDRLLRLRRWRPLHPRVYLAAGHGAGRCNGEVAVRAALLWAGDGAVLSGAAAAWWHGILARAPATITLTVGHGRSRRRPGVSAYRRDLAAVDVTTCRGVTVTALPLTVLEAAVELGAAGPELLDRALRGWVRFPAVHEAHLRALGRPGSGAAAAVLAAAAERSASVAEHLLVRLLEGAGIPARRGLPVPGRGAGVRFPAARVAVEVEGWAVHAGTGRERAAERARAALSLCGWTVLRCSWHDLAGRPRDVLAGIASALDGAATCRPHPTGSALRRG